MDDIGSGSLGSGSLRRSLANLDQTAIDALRGKFGAAAVVTGRALKSR